MREVAVYSDYLINYDYIVETLCVNRDKPAMKCNGRCHLSKQLVKEKSNDDEKMPTQREFDTKVNLFFELQVHLPQFVEEQKTSKEVLYYKRHPICSDAYTRLLRPPINVA